MSSILNVRKRGTKWEYRFEGAKINGKRNQISKGGFKTQGEAIAAGNKALNEYENSGLNFKPSKMSVTDYLNYWYENYAKVNLRYGTYSAYRVILNNHLIPRIGIYRLSSITTPILQQTINDIYCEQNFTKSYLKNILKVIKGAFKYAYKQAKFIKSNPAEDVELPRYDSSSDKSKEKVLSLENIETILNRFKDTPYHYLAMYLAFHCGLRVSEVYGLSWDNIDFENKTITINKIVTKRNQNAGTHRRGGIRGKAKTVWYISPCKTPSSYRTMIIDNDLIEELKKYKEWQISNQDNYGEFYMYQYIREVPDPDKPSQKLYQIVSADGTLPVALPKIDLIFTKDSGEFHGTDSMKYPSKIIHYELNIDFNFHSFRHTHATLLIENGANVKTVSERLGHSNIRTTLDTYTKNTIKMQNDAVSIFENAIKKRDNP